LKKEFFDIDGLLIKVILQEASEPETRQVEEWLARRESNRQYLSISERSGKTVKNWPFRVPLAKTKPGPASVSG